MAQEASARMFNAKHLTEALRRSGVLGDGRVTEVVVLTSRRTVLSRIERLQLAYDGLTEDAPEDSSKPIPRRPRLAHRGKRTKQSDLSFSARPACAGVRLCLRPYGARGPLSARGAHSSRRRSQRKRLRARSMGKPDPLYRQFYRPHSAAGGMHTPRPRGHRVQAKGCALSIRGTVGLDQG